MSDSMRDLTQEEIDLAPDWSTHYSVFDDGDIMFESDEFYMWLFVSGDMSIKEHCNEMEPESRPIPRKPFDISEHEFSDGGIAINTVNHVKGQPLSIYMPDEYYSVESGRCGRFEVEFTLNKADAIAIAKALGVTGGDL